MKSFQAMVIGNLKMTVRNRQAIFWNLAFPAIFILIFGAVFNNDSLSTIDIGIAGPESPTQTQIIAGLKSSEAFKLHTGSEQEERDALNENDRQIVLVIPATPDASHPIILLYNDQGGPSGAIAQSAVQSTLYSILGANAIVPIDAQPVSTLNLSYIDFFVPGILAMSIMNSGVIGLSTSFTSFRERGILRRIKVTPFPLWKFILARILASMVVIVASCAVLIGIGIAVWGLTIRGNWLLVLLSILVGSLSFLAIGYAISSFARDAESAASYANLITFPMLFLSGVFFPVGSMPSWLQPIIKVLPLRFLVDALRDPMMYGRGLGAIWSELLVLMAVFAICLLFAIRFFRWDSTAR